MRCPKCKIEGDEYFYPSTLARKGHNRRCKSCHKEHTNASRKLNPQWGAKYAKKYREANGEYLREYSRRFGAWRRQLCFDAYGRTCKCCGETNEAFLTLDHINNDGFSHKKPGRDFRLAGTNLYDVLIRENFPKYIQILCYNCNYGKNVNNGVCPHVSPKIYERLEHPKVDSRITQIRKAWTEPKLGSIAKVKEALKEEDFAAKVQEALV